MRKFIYIVYTLMVAVILTGCGADKFMKKGDKFYSLGEYYDAATQYKRAYSATPAKERATRGKRAKKLADCYRRTSATATITMPSDTFNWYSTQRRESSRSPTSH